MSHFYLDGQLVPAGTPGALPSVTTILGIRANHGLQAWRDRVGAEEADKRRDESADLGTRVHKMVEEIITSQDITIGDLLPYHEGFKSWCAKVSPEKMMSETFVTSEFGYAGTIDLICEIDGETWIIDFKTGSIKPEHGLQLAAYAQAYAERPDGWWPRQAVLQLTPELKRGWRFKEFTDPDDFKVFMAHKQIFDWQTQHNPPKLSAKWDGGIIHAS